MQKETGLEKHMIWKLEARGLVGGKFFGRPQCLEAWDFPLEV